MIWWFVIMGLSTLVVVCVAIALYIHLRRHLQKANTPHDEIIDDRSDRQTNGISR